MDCFLAEVGKMRKVDIIQMYLMEGGLEVEEVSTLWPLLL
jgi:hypothetical protein